MASLAEARSPVVEFEQVADEMRRYADGLRSALTSAADRTHEITSEDGSFTVTVDGRPRVRAIRIDPRAMRRAPEDLAAKIMAVVNEAVRTSRQEGVRGADGRAGPRVALDAQGRLRRRPPHRGRGGVVTDPEARLAELRKRLRDLPREQEAAGEAVRRLATETVTGRSSDRHVTVSADGHGTLVGIEFSADALRRLDSRTLGERLTEAVNLSLEAAERLQAEGRTTGAGFEAVLDEAMDMFTHRMDGILTRLDEIGDGLESG